MNVQKQQKGFTIIEVVLVLAIAALIFLMIFVALPALQRGQRDSARKNDASAIAAAMNTYRSNNRGSLAGITADSVKGGISQVTVDDIKEVESAGTGIVTETELDVAYVYTNAKCNDTGSQAIYSSSARSGAVVVEVESGANKQLYCVDA